MVFESVVVEVLNKFLGEYVENLNSSQLKLSIWGGDVSLNNLNLKENALEQLNIPVRAVYGNLGKLVLKIPWKNLYKEPVVANIQKLYLILSPTAEVKYDAEREEAAQLASKRAKLQAMEEAKKKQREAESGEEIDETFVERLVAQIVKNVQVSISEIHIRYEDSVTDPDKPFSIGFTLKNLSAETTNGDWVKCIIQDAVSKIHKLLELEGFAIYWNPSADLYSKKSPDVIKQFLEDGIATKSFVPEGYKYVLGPINATAKMVLNPKPEADQVKFSIPKLTLSCNMETLSISLTKAQYQDIVKVAESFDRMRKALPYRQWRPNVNQYRGHYKQWWQFAYQCVVEEHVRRPRRNWSWLYMQAHRQLCKDYAAAYQAKLISSGKLNAQQQNCLECGEKKLDLLNLVVIRQEVELKVERTSIREKREAKSAGWFGWFSRGSAESTSESNIMEKIQNQITPEEKQKLYRAIDYHENLAPVDIPLEYVAADVSFLLSKLQVTVNDGDVTVLHACVDTVALGVKQRPSASAIRLDVSLRDFTLSGLEQNGVKPQIAFAYGNADASQLVDLTFETSPLDSKCDSRVRMSAKGLRVIYDAQTAIEIINVFKVPSDNAALIALQEAAENRLEHLKEKSLIGIEYAVKKHAFLEIDINVEASCIIVPLKGVYSQDVPCTVVKLGAISVKTEPRSEKALNIHELFKDGMADEDIMAEVAQHSYDNIGLQLTEIQIVVAMAKEDWASAITSPIATPLHLLEPSNLFISIQKCLLTNDHRLPHVKLRANLEKVAVCVSEQRLLTLFEILISMPLPGSEEPAKLSDNRADTSRSLLRLLDVNEKRRSAKTSSTNVKEEDFVQLTELEAAFVINQLSFAVYRADSSVTDPEKLAALSLNTFEIMATKKTFTLEVALRLHDINMQHHRKMTDPISIIETPGFDTAADQYLLSLKYSNVDKKCPEFRSIYGSVEQLVELDFQKLILILHLEMLQEFMVMASQYQSKIEALQKSQEYKTIDAGPLETIMEEEEGKAFASSKSRILASLKQGGTKKVESILLKVKLNMLAFNVRFSTDKRPLADVKIEGLAAGLIQKPSYMQVDCVLSDIKVEDLNKVSKHKEILKVLGGDVIQFQLVLYNKEVYTDVADVNMSIDLNINCLRFIFLNWFVSAMMDFLDNFQAAQEAIIEASTAAADAAKSNAQNALESLTKIRFKCNLNAPIIVIPENSTSKRAIVIDLGKMTLRNKIVDVTLPGVTDKVTVDELMLELGDLKLSSVELTKKDLEYAWERKLLKPLTFKLFVKRNISPWCNQIPNIDVSGRLKTINITIGHIDYSSIMRILNENLGEGVSSKPKTPAPKVKRETVKKVKSKTSEVMSHKSDSSEVIEAGPVVVNTMFCFTMDSLIIDLKSSKQKESDSLIEVAESESVEEVDLARFTVTLLSAKGRILSDSSMQMTLMLIDLTLDDTRPDRGKKISRYLERRREPTTNTNPYIEGKDRVRSMVDVIYTTKKLDTFIDIRVFSFDLILAMDFINRLSNFTTVSLSGPAQESGAGTNFDTKSIAAMGANISHTTLQERPSTSAEKRFTVMTVNMKIEQPDIILVESLEDRLCDALVMNMEVHVKYRQIEERMVLDCGVSGLQIVSRTIGSADKTLHHYLLAPTYLSIAGSKPSDSGMHLDVFISDIKVTLSPEMLVLLQRVMDTVTGPEIDQSQKKSEIITYKNNVWDVRSLDPTNYWFLKIDEAEEAISANYAPPEEEAPIAPTGEICLMSSPSIVFCIEMEIGDAYLPVLVMKASLIGHVKNWSSDLNLDATLAMQISYYNITRAVWEPLVEPVEVFKDSTYSYEPWELKMELNMKSASHRAPPPSALQRQDEATQLQMQFAYTPNVMVQFSSADTLEITLTNSALELLTMLGNAFNSQNPEPSESLLKTKNNTSTTILFKKRVEAPYFLHNCTGYNMLFSLENNDDWMFPDSSANVSELILAPDAEIPLKMKRGDIFNVDLDQQPKLSLNIQIIEFKENIEIVVGRVVKRYYPVGQRSKNEWRLSLIADIVIEDAAMHVYLRSIVQVINKLSLAVGVYYMKPSGNEVELIGTVEPNKTMRLPLATVHTKTAELFFCIDDENFAISEKPFIWRELEQGVTIEKLMQCACKDRSKEEFFYYQAIGTTVQAFAENTERQTLSSCCYDIVLKPVVALQNCLPVDVTITQVGYTLATTFSPGEMKHMPHINPKSINFIITIENYLDKCWSCTKNLPADTDITAWEFTSHDSPEVMSMILGMHCVIEEGIKTLSLYSPFWMLNKTGLTLSYKLASKKSHKNSGRSSKNKMSRSWCQTKKRDSSSYSDDSNDVIFHPPTYNQPIMFCYRAKNFLGKKKAMIRVESGEWSDKFSLDVPGSSGVINCKHEGYVYEVAVQNQLTFNSLTKMVIFTPYCQIINELPLELEYQEFKRPGDPWYKVAANSCAPFWPKVVTEKVLRLRIADKNTEITAPFYFHEQNNTCLKLKNEYGGLRVAVDVTEGATYIVINQYMEGYAPALIVNFSDHPITFYEKEGDYEGTDNPNYHSEMVLPTMTKVLYTWENPTGSRQIAIKGGENDLVDDLKRDGFGKFKLTKTSTISWVSFLDGIQRVLLFTDDTEMARSIHNIGDMTKLDTEVIFSLQGMGVSLVNDRQFVEILYFSVSNSGTIWEQCHIGAKRYKKLDEAKAHLYEAAFQKYLLERDVEGSDVSPIVKLADKSEVNFEEMRILKPSPRILRRTHEPGLYASYGFSQNCLRIHALLYRLQIDQQQKNAIFPVLLAPVPPPRSITNDAPGGVRPFMEVSIVERVIQHSKVKQYKYFKVLVQEYHVKVDMGLIGALYEMFPEKRLNEQEALKAFEDDMIRATQSREAFTLKTAASEQKNFYDDLHLSPLKVHLSFSMGSKEYIPSFVGRLLRTIGVTLTDMNDVIFKLSYYERNFEFLSNRELMEEVKVHYSGQALKQLYVFVFGLDVIGNPYGLVVGIKKGVEDLFYEPYQGLIQGPGEFAEGLYIGVRSLMGHTVGGVAGAMSRITGTMGSGLAALSMDKDFQTRRKNMMNKPAANVQEGLAQSGKGLVLGVVDGVTGVFTNPIEGAQEGGVEGFFKGLGKGMVGLVARPATGLVDFASGSLSAVTRAAEITDYVTKRRPERFLPPNHGIKYYSKREAEGHKIIIEAEKGKFVKTDTYVAHIWLNSELILMCTDKRIMVLEKNAVFGGWQAQCSFLWEELTGEPIFTPHSIFIPTPRKKMFGVFSSSSAGKMIHVIDENQLKFIQKEIIRLYNENSVAR